MQTQQSSVLSKRALKARLVCMFKNWKLLFKKICGNTCGWKSVLKCVKYCLKTENDFLKTQIKHPLSIQRGLKRKVEQKHNNGKKVKGKNLWEEHQGLDRPEDQ